MKLFGSIKSKITKNKSDENVPHLEVVELELVHCNLVNNDYQQDSRILYTFVPNKTFDSLLETSPTNHVFLKTHDSEFQEIYIWFTDQTSTPLEVEDKVKMRYSIEPKERGHVKGYGFLSFARKIGIHAAKVAKNMSDKYSQKLLDTAKKSAIDAIKTASKRAVQKTAEATGDLVGNKFADKITSASKKSLKKPHDEEKQSTEVNNEIPKERYISPKKATNY